MSTKYLDYSGLLYFWGKLKNYLATTTHSGLMSATDKTKVDMITTDGTIAFYRKEESVYVTEIADEDTIPIGISGFTTADMLLVDINGLDLSEGDEYVISGTNIVLDTPIGTIGTVVHFVVLRAITATAADVATLKGEKGDDGVVQDVLQNGVSVLGQDGIARIVADVDYDSGWIDITPQSPFALYNATSVCRCRRIGHTVQIAAELKVTSNIPTGTEKTMFTLPEGFRPFCPIIELCQGSGMNIWLCRIQPDGSVLYNRHRSGATEVQAETWQWFPIYFSFLAE